ncbi:MerR family transcriptional regulator [Priestia megaterium]
MPKNTDEGIVYTLKDTVKLTGLSIDLIRLYEKEFNLQIQRTEGAIVDIQKQYRFIN